MMRHIFLLLPLAALLSCQSPPSNDAQSQKAALAEMEAQLRGAQDVTAKADVAEDFLDKTQAFVSAFPTDSLAPAYLFKAADVARGLRKYGLAIQMAGKVWRDYPDYPMAPDAMFLQGFTYDAHLEDPDQARIYYEQFLEKYPDHPFTSNVQQLLSVLGKDPAEMVREFEKQ
jgi:tetratricopeptide (TPR) repeat protein